MKRELDAGVRYQCYAHAQAVATMLDKYVQYCSQASQLELLLLLLLSCSSAITGALLTTLLQLYLQVTVHSERSQTLILLQLLLLLLRVLLSDNVPGTCGTQ
jgi:hypothetical protein